MSEELDVQTVATYRIREMKLAEDLTVYTEHTDKVVIPAGTIFTFSEFVRLEKQWPEDRQTTK
ncbi:MAG: hypothetical protein GY952_14020 [Rhodobacteraceae bacterium]|nr:hypothetical protein [Paracoccaceae bacterium]